MTRVFGEVADVYDQVRPGYPPEVPAAILAYHGSVPAHVVELGAGTGKGTEALATLGAPITCIEPDPRMAAVLAAKFPDVTVVASAFEQWTPPPGGVPMVACALAWHWLDAATRCQRAHDALAPGGVLAVFGHRYDFADPSAGAAVAVAYRTVDPSLEEHLDGWFRDEIADSALFVDITTELVRRQETLAKDRYLRLVQTFGPYRKGSAEQRARALALIGDVLDDLGGDITLDLRTTLVLARRPR
jgi:trans-aconitate methyltransferase